MLPAQRGQMMDEGARLRRAASNERTICCSFPATVRCGREWGQLASVGQIGRWRAEELAEKTPEEPPDDPRLTRPRNGGRRRSARVARNSTVASSRVLECGQRGTGALSRKPEKRAGLVLQHTARLTSAQRRISLPEREHHLPMREDSEYCVHSAVTRDTARI